MGGTEDGVRFGLDVSQHQLTWDELLARARFAEDLGFESAWVFDHFKALYGDPSGPCMDGWTVLAALAAATDSIRIGSLVTGVTYRHPSILAAQAASVDHISGGRLELGIGAAWFEQEHRELGIDFPPPGERTARLEEALEVIRRLLTEDRAHYEGRYFRLEGASYNPKPVQKPHPPLWIGANGTKRMIPLAARVADVWHASGGPEKLTRKRRVLEAEAERVGRDPSEIVRATWLSISEPLDEVKARAEELRDVGIGYFTVSWPEQGRERVERFVTDVMQKL